MDDRSERCCDTDCAIARPDFAITDDRARPATHSGGRLRSARSVDVCIRLRIFDESFPLRISISSTANRNRRARGAVENGAAVEIEKGRLRRLLLDDFHQLLGKASAKNASAFPHLPQPRRLLTLFIRLAFKKPIGVCTNLGGKTLQSMGRSQVGQLDQKESSRRFVGSQISP